MKIALVNPPWSFDGSIYFGCREPHLPLEYGYARTLLAEAGDDIAGRGGPQAVDMTRLPALRWPGDAVRQHAHHHHRFDPALHGPGAEMEVSRGCPYHCTFCAKDNFRDRYRRRLLATILDEVDGLIAAGASYVYFIDEIFLPWRELLEALVERPVEFGVQTRIDLWRPDMLDLLGRAGCVSIEAGVESLTPA